MKAATVAGICLALLLATGCATPTVELKYPHGYVPAPDAPQYAWHQLRFKWFWPEDEEPDWSLDPLIADLVLSDLITRHRESLPLWRFHRRAGRSPAGHQFSFIFYTSPSVAREIRDSATGHPVTRRLLETGRLKKAHLTRPGNAAALSATSDPNWPEAVRATWPMFIMGVSQTSLGLVELNAGDTTGLDDDLERALKHYRGVNDSVDEIWSRHAQHAFFHHLSGVFGYEPVILRKRLRF